MLGLLSKVEGQVKKEALDEFHGLLRMEEISWRQKSRATWLKEGDQITKKFHQMANMRLSSNTISKLCVDRTWVYDQRLIRDHIEQYFVNLYTKPFTQRPVLEGVEFDVISEAQQRWMERPFMKEEVKQGLNSMEDDKALGPDGFPIKFIKVC